MPQDGLLFVELVAVVVVEVLYDARPTTVHGAALG
jgi:hypothetical protein